MKETITYLAYVILTLSFGLFSVQSSNAQIKVDSKRITQTASLKQTQVKRNVFDVSLKRNETTNFNFTVNGKVLLVEVYFESADEALQSDRISSQLRNVSSIDDYERYAVFALACQK